jgi:hypothetical protein
MNPKNPRKSVHGKVTYLVENFWLYIPAKSYHFLLLKYKTI